MGAGSILIVDDDPDLCEVLLEALRRRGFSAQSATGVEAAVAHLRQQSFDAVLADVRLAGASGLDLCRLVAEIRPDVPVVVMTAHGNLDVAVEAIRAGAYDFIEKPLPMEALVLALGRAVRHRQLSGEVQRLRATVGERGPGGMVADSPSMRRVHELIQQVAAADASVLITGESGTGKELVAREIHARGPRRSGPFVAVNCAAMPSALLESELFGHVRGAFTDARRAHQGLFVQASGGTLFLDEVAEMPPEMQVKLLRALQERRIRPVGAEEEVAVDVRLITATNRDLESDLEDGRFRTDLYYRVNVVHIPIPPLRARPGDVLLLAHHFLRRHAMRTGKEVVTISQPAARRLVEYDWPGNVRELENCMERAVTLTTMSEVGVDDLPDRLRDHRATDMVIALGNPEELITLAEMERQYILKVLKACGSNKSQAAKVLGLDRRTLYRRLGAAER